MKAAVITAALLALVAVSQAQGFRAMLVSQWIDGGNQMCRYDNGTVLNVGARICPLSIPA